MGAVGRGRRLCAAYTRAANRRGRTLGNAGTGAACCWSSRGRVRRGDILGKGACCEAYAAALPPDKGLGGQTCLPHAAQRP